MRTKAKKWPRFLVAIATVSSGHTAGAQQEDANQCFAPLEVFCASSAHWCRIGYTENVRETEEFAKQRFCMKAWVGRCGEFRVTHTAFFAGSQTFYFDATGTLIAVRTATNAQVSGSSCPGWTHFGRKLSCEVDVDREYCKRK
jgi:hypothetical protein